MNVSFLAHTQLFQGATENEIQAMLHCLGAVTRRYAKGDFIYRSGQQVEQLGLVLSGRVMVTNNDFWGNQSILAHVGPGEIFAETYACVPGEPLLVDVVTAEKTEVLFLNTAKILRTCTHSCPHHHAIISNLLQLSAQKNLQLSRRILYTSAKSIRGRLMSYLSDQAKETGTYTITTPFNRQQLADYLSVDRSAMCSELSKMQRDGILTYQKNTFQLNKWEDTSLSD